MIARLDAVVGPSFERGPRNSAMRKFGLEMVTHGRAGARWGRPSVPA